MTAIRRKKVNVPTLIGRGITMLILIGLSILVLIPLVWTVCMALKPAGEIYNGRFFPTTLVWGNFVEAVTSIDFFLYLLNTLKVVIPNVIGQVISCSLVAYGFSRYNFKGKRVWFLILLATMMIPGQITMIPQFLLYREMGWVNTYLPLTVPAFFATSGYNIFLIRSYMSGIPRDFDEAATIDGATRLQQIIYVTIPSILPTIMVMFIMSVGRLLSLGFEKVLLMYTPSNSSVSDIIDTLVYRTGLANQNYSYATAIGLFSGVIGVVLVSLSNFISRKTTGDGIY